jgi:hypothetical protein
MPSRREFIQAGLAISVAPVTVPAHAAEPVAPFDPPAPATAGLDCVVCDLRSPWSRDVAAEAERLGLRVERTQGDITDFWFNDLSRRWKTAPVAIAGLTGQGPLFCLERFGWDHGLRVVFRGTHRLRGTTRIEHEIAVTGGAVAAAWRPGLESRDWARTLTYVLRSYPRVLPTSTASLRGVVPGDRGDVHDLLVSWVIAPRSVSGPDDRRL